MERLYRSRDEKIIFGVCGGLSRYFNVDVTLVRLIFIVGVLLKGITLLIYIILALITPEEKAETVEAETTETPAVPAIQETERRQKLLAYGLILVGIVLFVQEMMPFWLSDSQLLAVLLVLIGAALLLKRKEPERT
ncbi:MAG: PspC domain-containing protein [Archaeoglobaceae archaeon]